MITTEIAAQLGDQRARTQLGDSAPPLLSEAPVSQWSATLSALGPQCILEAAIGVVKSLLPEWRESRPQDRQPVRAVEAAERLLASPTENLRSHARAVAKACTKSRRDSLGYEHRIAEAARALALAAAADPKTKSRVNKAIEAMALCEEHALYRFAVAGVYDKEEEVRGQILSVVLKVAVEFDA